MILDLFLLRVFHAPSCCSFTSNLTMFSLIIDHWIDNGIYNAFIIIIIIINVIIDKSRLCYKITIKYWQKVLYSQLYYNKSQIKTSTKKIRMFYTPRFFSGQNKKKCPNYASKYGISKSLRQNVSNVPGKGGIKELQIQPYWALHTYNRKC